MRQQFIFFMNKLKLIDASLKGFKKSDDPMIVAQARKIEKETRRLRSLVLANKN